MLTITKSIPTNLITGFLGVGKTTAIQQLLLAKPEGERWAVLVNEFGEIGVDAGLMRTELGDGELFIREVPGGCMCCAAGITMQVALNQLIAKAKPDRLLIEPSGLGHPSEVVQVLLQPEYAQVIDLRAVLTLVDARKISDPRYTEHTIFNQQLDIADIVVANKKDLCSESNLRSLVDYLKRRECRASLKVVQQGAVDQEWLDGRHAGGVTGPSEVPHVIDQLIMAEPKLKDLQHGFERRDKYADGFFYGGWSFSAEYDFDEQKLKQLMHALFAERVKGIFQLHRDAVGLAVNRSDEMLTMMPVTETTGSRIEVIDASEIDLESLETSLLGCISRKS